MWTHWPITDAEIWTFWWATGNLSFVHAFCTTVFTKRMGYEELPERNWRSEYKKKDPWKLEAYRMKLSEQWWWTGWRAIFMTNLAQLVMKPVLQAVRPLQRQFLNLHQKKNLGEHWALPSRMKETELRRVEDMTTERTGCIEHYILWKECNSA